MERSTKLGKKKVMTAAPFSKMSTIPYLSHLTELTIFLNDLLMTWNIIHVIHVRKWKEYYELLSYSDTMNMTFITGKGALNKQRNVVFFTQNKSSRLVT